VYQKSYSRPKGVGFTRTGVWKTICFWGFLLALAHLESSFGQWSMVD
jgi:hypothetical protein